MRRRRTTSSSTARARSRKHGISPPSSSASVSSCRAFAPFPRAPPVARLRVFLLPDQQAVGRTIGSPSVAGYYIPDARGLMLVGTRHRARPLNDIRSAHDGRRSRSGKRPLPRIYPPFHLPIFPGDLSDLVQRGLRGILGHDRDPARRRGRGRRAGQPSLLDLSGPWLAAARPPARGAQLRRARRARTSSCSTPRAGCWSAICSITPSASGRSTNICG